MAWDSREAWNLEMIIPELGSQRLVPHVVSCISVLCSQLLLYLVAHFCTSLSVLIIVVISGVFTLLAN